MTKEYNDQFYRVRNNLTEYAAEAILGLVRDVIPPIYSAVDLGCGVGTWLSVLKNHGANKIVGFDGPWVNKELLEIPKENFIEQDLRLPIKLTENYDLAISLEVAEHLPANNAKKIIASLAELSDFVLFSAAIPGQGGVGHLNEQWPNYWISLFDENGYECIDFIRKQIWQDQNIPYWYRQNIFLFVKQERLPDLKITAPLQNHVPPELYLLSFNKLVINPEMKLAGIVFLSAIHRLIRRVSAKLLAGKK